ncbi:hypothetical protein DFH09DRAFT_936512, partial [Mycena vulgaris]
MSLGRLVFLLNSNKDSSFEIHTFAEIGDVIKCTTGQECAVELSKRVWEATGYRFNYKKKSTSRASTSVHTYTFHCAQLKGEETKNHLTQDPRKRRARMKMDRFNCDGWLHITADDTDTNIVTVRMTHHRCHTPYLVAG